MPGRQVTLLTAEDIEYTTALVVIVCSECAVPFGIPDSLNRRARKDPDRTFWCANGHSQHYPGKTEEDRLREQLTAERRRCQLAEDTARRQRNRAVDAERSARAYKGVATRQRNRIARGVCPCCNRYFPAMDQHMAAKHPAYAGEPLVTP